MLPISFWVICIVIFRDYVNMIPKHLLMLMQIILVMGSIFMIVGGCFEPYIDYKSRDKNRSKLSKEKNIKATFYLNVDIIIENTFFVYFLMYTILGLYEISIS